MVQIPQMDKPLQTTLDKQEPTVVKFLDRTPANWNIEATGEDTILAANTKTFEKFQGTIEEFNAALRG